MITYEAKSQSPLVMNKMFIGILGALAGNGKIFFNEVVEDLAVPGFIGTHNALLDNNSQLPYVTVMNFSRSSTHIKVKKTFTLSAVDGPGLDLAQLSLNEQNIGVVPEPASMAVLATGALALLRRRRKAA
ncbi:MAG TPA: PEP-CTERM sorting domain-containing protein [Fimbriimonadaceae bacterium]|nr:PEP-CTERM sorting domain-containing protein [Fimbriimonadaceae bacterium]